MITRLDLMRLGLSLGDTQPSQIRPEGTLGSLSTSMVVGTGQLENIKYLPVLGYGCRLSSDLPLHGFVL